MIQAFCAPDVAAARPALTKLELKRPHPRSLGLLTASNHHIRGVHAVAGEAGGGSVQRGTGGGDSIHVLGSQLLETLEVLFLSYLDYWLGDYCCESFGQCFPLSACRPMLRSPESLARPQVDLSGEKRKPYLREERRRKESKQATLDESGRKEADEEKGCTIEFQRVASLVTENFCFLPEPTQIPFLCRALPRLKNF